MGSLRPNLPQTIRDNCISQLGQLGEQGNNNAAEILEDTWGMWLTMDFLFTILKIEISKKIINVSEIDPRKKS